jgi:RNA polymerase sigma factor (sigma-70 family)
MDSEAKRIPSDSELLCAIQNGVPEAKEELVRRYDPVLLVIITGYLRKNGCNQPSQHADGSKSGAWVNIFTYHGDATNIGDPKAWLAVIAINAANKHLRECIKEQNDFTEIEEKHSLPEGDLFDFYETKNAGLTAEMVLSLADNISPEFSLILTLHHLEELTVEEIAVRLRKPPATVRVIYYRGLLKLRRMIKRKGG